MKGGILSALVEHNVPCTNDELGNFDHGASVGITVGLSVGPGGFEGIDIRVRWVPVPFGHLSLDESFPCGKFITFEDTIVISIKASEDNTGIDGGEGGHGVSVFVVVQTVGVILVNKGPVFDTKVVEEGLGGIGHTDVFGSGLGTGGQFSGCDFSITVSVAEVPEWLPVGVWDLNMILISEPGVVPSVVKNECSTYIVGSGGKLLPVGLGKVENVLGFVPPVINNELGWGGSGGGDESGEFHLFSFWRFKS